jgi:glycosyltransferase involved in cell wall biosynthesis
MTLPPRIAVIVPAFNAATTLVRAVDSIAASAAHAREAMGLDLRTEIVVADDASRDATPQVAKDLSRRLAEVPHLSFKLVTQTVNRGAGQTRNLGVRHAAAPLIGFLDADDEFLPPHLGLCVSALLAEREVGYVWTRRRLDVPVHESWGPSLDRRTVMNLCVRRIWHEISKGFPEHPDFARMSTEDSFYRIVLEALVQGLALPEETVLIHHSPGNSLDRQKKKFATPISQWDGAQESFVPSDGIVAELNQRLAYVERLKAEMAGG